MKTHTDHALQARRCARLALPFLFAVALCVTANPDTATAAIAAVSQITQATSPPSFVSEPSINATGDRVAFVSNADLVPGGNANSKAEVFLFATGSGFEQVTSSVDGGSSQPSISADGSRIAFRSTADLVPGGNPDHNSEIFLAVRRFHNVFRLVQITHSLQGPGVTNSQPSLSADGGRVAFLSTADLVPGGNPDLSLEIFLAQGSEIKQITHNDPNTFCQEPSTSSDGSSIAFTCTGDLIPDGIPGRHEALFLFTQGQGLTQITPTSATADVARPVISANGLHIAFTSTVDLVGSGDSINPQVFLFSVGEGFTQVSSGASGGSQPSISADGSRISFVSGGQLFIALGSGTPAPVTSASADARFRLPVLSGNGVVIAFESSGDHVPGGNTDRNSELFLARLRVGPTARPTAAGSESD